MLPIAQSCFMEFEFSVKKSVELTGFGRIFIAPNKSSARKYRPEKLR